METYAENVFLPFGKNALSTLAFSVYVQRLRGSKRSSAFFVRGSFWGRALFYYQNLKGERQMNAIMCELCGSNDVVKQGEYFVCQHCGTKYSLEDARKLIGTVKIDRTDEAQNYLQNARRAKAKEDWEETEKYYNMVEQIDPDNIEAIFYSSYGKAKASLLVDDIYKRQAVFNSLQKSISIIDEHYDINKESELKPIIESISNDIINLCNSNFVYTETRHDPEGFGAITYTYTNNKYMTAELFDKLNYEYATALGNIIKKLLNGGNTSVDYLFERIVIHLRSIIDDAEISSWDNKKKVAAEVDKYHEFWHTVNPAHTIPSKKEIDIVREAEQTITKQNEQQKNSGGCYVATAVYGSYDCPQVWTLRRYRDYTLAETWFGRLFIALYYAISPTLVKWFGETQWFKNLWKPRLDRMVKRLNDEGVVDTPYQDRQW